MNEEQTVQDSTPDEQMKRLKSAVASLDRAMSAYGHLMSAKEGSGELPVLTWPANDGERPIEVHTDLNLLGPEAREEVLASMAAVHGADIHKSLAVVGESYELLRTLLTPAPEVSAEPAAE